jgi:glyoxylase-like metal-dependent hydrolase (beta-lactamase superfamily II)
MTCSRLAAAAVAAAAISLPAHAQFDLENAVVENIDLGDGLHMLTGAGGNIALLVGPDGAMMVDDQFNELADRIAAKIGELAPGEAGEVRFVVNTHYHFDHAGGNEAWNGRGATIVAHDNVRERLSNPQPNVLSGELEDAEPPGAWPVVTFSDDVTFHMNGQTVHAFHVPPAHTDGDSMVYFEEANVLHGGDVYTTSGFPLIDAGAGGSLDGFVASMTLALETINEDTRIIPGHGPLSRYADLEARRDKLQEFADLLKPLAESDLSVEEIIAARPLDGHDEGYAGGFISTENFITATVNRMRATAEP